MELRHLRYFLAVAEELHFSRAAARLHISQPPLSQQIRDLEAELEVELFHRTRRNVQLTEAGRVFLEETRVILAQVDRAKRRAGQVERGSVGQLTVGTVTSIASGFHRRFIEILQTFSKRYPEVHFDLHLLNTGAQLEALQKGAIQVGFLTPVGLDDDLAIEVVERAPLAVALPESHPLAARPTLPLPDVAVEPNVILSRKANPAFHDLLLSWCRDSGCALNVAHESNSMHMSLTHVAMGSGVSLVTSSFAEASLPGIVIRELEGPVPELTSGAVYKRGTTSRTVRSLLKVVREVARPQTKQQSAAAP